MAKGSTKSLGGWEPKICDICGNRVLVTGEVATTYEFDHRDGSVHSWHVACKFPQLAAAPIRA